jgi:rRNA maturation RNase YbeY
MPPANNIRFFFQSGPVTLKNRSALKEFIEKIFRREGKTLVSLNYIFLSDKSLLAINQQFLNHDFYTDIITYDLSSHKAKVEAEVYISINRVRDNARALEISFKQELLRVIIHGALHLCGYKDKTPRDIKIMRAREDFYLFNFIN